SSAALSNLAVSVLLPMDRLNSPAVENLVAPLASLTLDTSTPDVALLTFTALPGQSLAGTQQLARLHFTAAPGQSSAFIPLQYTALTAQRAQPGLSPTVILNSGRVTVVDGHALLEANVNPANGTRSVTLYGRPGTNYMVETSTNLTDPNAWQPWRSITLTNLLWTLDSSAGSNAPG